MFCFRGIFHEFYEISYIWYSTLGCILTVIFGLILSAITIPQNVKELDEDLLSAPIRSLIHFMSCKSKDVSTIDDGFNMHSKMYFNI